MNLTIRLRQPHPKQCEFVECGAKRIIIRAGRRGGKTVGLGIVAVRRFLEGRRVLYASPTEDQVGTFWFEVKRALRDAIDAGVFYKNESLHLVELPGTKQRIRAKTAWNADTLRGDFADLLILDEFQMMHEETWNTVGSPMLLDNGGSAVFIYTPPSRRTIAHSRADNPLHAAKMFADAEAMIKSGNKRWSTFSFSSHDNPTLDKEALSEITADMTTEAYQSEIMAIDVTDSPGALWKRGDIDHVTSTPRLYQIAIGVDPHGGATECGIVAVGMTMIDGKPHIYVLEDVSTDEDETTWGRAVVALYNKLKANVVVAEVNFGGTMVSHVLKTIPGGERMMVKTVSASRGKDVRAEPIVAMYQQGRGHHLGNFHRLENELCQWVPHTGMESPNRLDALVWAATELTETVRGGRGT